MNIDKIKQQAIQEIKEEDFWKEVKKYKQKLREKKSIWSKIFPYKILIIRKEG